MAMNASGICDTARVLHLSPTIVIKELKKEPELHRVHHTMLACLNPEQIEVEIWRADEPEGWCGCQASNADHFPGATH